MALEVPLTAACPPAPVIPQDGTDALISGLKMFRWAPLLAAENVRTL